MNVDLTQPHLLIESADPPKAVALKVEGRFIVGRGGPSDLLLNDVAISRQHCARAPTRVDRVACTSRLFAGSYDLRGGTLLRGIPYRAYHP